MKTTRIITFSSFILLTLSSFVPSALAAETGSASVNIRQQLKANREETRSEIKASVRDFRSDAKDLRVSVTPGMRGTIAPTIKAERGELKEEVKDIKATGTQNRQSLLNKARIQVITKIYENLKASLNKRYNTLNEALSKIQTKINDKSTAGKDVTSVNKIVDQVKTAQTSFDTDMKALDDKFNQIIASAKPWTMVSDLRASGKKVETDLQQIRKLEVSALKALLAL